LRGKIEDFDEATQMSQNSLKASDALSLSPTDKFCLFTGLLRRFTPRNDGFFDFVGE